MKTGVVIIFVFLCFILSYVTIWSLNTLFPVLAIPYTFETIVAAFVLILIFDPLTSKESK